MIANRPTYIHGTFVTQSSAHIRHLDQIDPLVCARHSTLEAGKVVRHCLGCHLEQEREALDDLHHFVPKNRQKRENI